jgi:hypothetical protein
LTVGFLKIWEIPSHSMTSGDNAENWEILSPARDMACMHNLAALN